MHVFSLDREQQWNPKRHVEKILGKIADGDVTIGDLSQDLFHVVLGIPLLLAL